MVKLYAKHWLQEWTKADMASFQGAHRALVQREKNKYKYEYKVTHETNTRKGREMVLREHM